MGLAVCNGAQLTCMFGAAPSSMVVLPAKKVLITMPAAVVTDNIPMVNIMPFGLCNCPGNPTCYKPVFTPSPCVPVIPGPWVPGSVSCFIGGVPALESNSRLVCAWGGMIQVVNPGQTKTIIGK